MKNRTLTLSERVSLRPAAIPADEDFLKDLYASTREDIDTLPLAAEQKNSLLLMQYEAQKQGYAAHAPDAVHYIVVFDGEPIGRYMVDRGLTRILGVDLALLPRFRGMGIGSHILRTTFKEAAETNRSFVFEVVKTNRAYELYQRLGCVVTGETSTHYKMAWQPPDDGN